MAVIKTYKIKLDISKNQVVEDIATYLSSLTPIYHADSDFQYVKPALEMKIKLALTDSFYSSLIEADALNAAAMPTLGNYLSITQGNGTSANTITWYFFITSARWIAEKTVELTLALDTLNTFWQDIQYDMLNSTHITRQHKDRLVPVVGASDVFSRVIDRRSEGFNLTKYRSTVTPIKLSNNALKELRWYLIYKTISTDENAAVNCFCCASSDIAYLDSVTAPDGSWQSSDFTSTEYRYLLFSDGPASVTAWYYASGNVTRTLSATIPAFRCHKLSGSSALMWEYWKQGTGWTGWYDSAPAQAMSGNTITGTRCY